MNGLKFFRKKYKMTSEELANKLGVSRQTVSAWETGAREIPKERLKDLAIIFETNPDSFCERNDDELEKASFLIEREKLGNSEATVSRMTAYAEALFSESLDMAYTNKKKEQKDLEKLIHESFAGPSDTSLRRQMLFMDRGITLYSSFLNLVNLLNQQEKNEQKLYFNRIMEFVMGMEMEMGSVVEMKNYKKGSPMEIDHQSIEDVRKLFSSKINESKDRLADIKSDMDYMVEMIVDKSAKGLDVSEDIEKLNRSMLDNGVPERKPEK